MPPKYQPATGRVQLEGINDVLTLIEAAQATGLSSNVIRKAITTGALKAFTPGGVSIHATGRGLGYRVRKADLQRWFLNEE